MLLIRSSLRDKRSSAAAGTGSEQQKVPLRLMERHPSMTSYLLLLVS
jgi:hypothetical protein